MRVMYFAYMFHTNQVPIMKGWLEEGDDALFVCYTKGKTENHQYGKPYILGYSKVFHFINTFYEVLNPKNKFSSFPEAFSGKFGFPSYRKTKRLLKEWKPEIVIIRDRYLYSIVVYLVCRSCKIPTILYNQNPYCPEVIKHDVLHKMIYKLSPKVRMTPVYGDRIGENHNPNSFYVPFVIDSHVEPKQKKYFKDDKINILCIGKYEERKNQLMLLKIFKRIYQKYNLTLTLAGEVSTEYHRVFYKKITDYIEKNELQQSVTCYQNYPPQEMNKLYEDADVFILPSTGEFASVSQLEAMSYSLPAIISDTNGTSCYIHEGENGYIFLDNNEEDLEYKMRLLLGARENILRMGKRSSELVQSEHSFATYKEQILKMKTRVESMDNIHE